jgi:hypothetical protein
MADHITIQFTPTSQDYVKTYRALQFRSPFTRIVYGALAVLELCMLASILLPGRGSNARLWPVAIAVPIFIALAVVLPGASIGNKAQHNERMMAGITWEMDDTQLHMANRFTETKYDWGSFLGLVENREYFFLRHSANKRLYNFIPKRAFASEAELTAFREAFKRHTGGSQEPAIRSTAG